jgi:hypothetical protein
MVEPSVPPAFAVPADGPWIDTWLGQPRFGRYLQAVNGDRLRAIALYEWNARVSAGFQRDLAHVEVALRNAYDTAAIGWGGSGHWLLDGYAGVFAPVFRTKGRRSRDINEHPRDQVRQAIRSAGGPNATAGKVIAQLSFGFWRYLSTSAHEKTLWVPYLHRAFAPGTDRARIDAPIGRLHELRNRVAHHEHLLNQNVLSRFNDLLDVAQALQPDLATFLSTSSDIPHLAAWQP